MSEYRDPDSLIARAKSGDPRRDQHFLVDDRVLDRLPTYLDGTHEHLLEIGPGTGALTDRLLARAERVTAIERDGELVSFLREEFADAVAGDRLQIIEGDALAVEWPAADALVSNLPYGVSSELLFTFLPRGQPGVITVQREFAERMAAEPGSDAYGRLSVTAQHYAAVTVEEVIPPAAFEPRPAVESAVVSLEPREPDYEVPEELFFNLVRAIFTQRRKTLRNALRNTTHISGIEEIEAVVAALDEELLSQRPGSLDQATLASITQLAAGVESRA